MRSRGEVILFPPQHYLMWQLSKLLKNERKGTKELEAQRDETRKFLGKGGANGAPWAEKCISPQTLELWNGRAVLDLISQVLI